MIHFQLTGMERILANLDKLGKDGARKAMRKSLMTCADHIVEAAKMKALPAKSGVIRGTLRKSIDKKVIQGDKFMRVIIGPRRGIKIRIGTHHKGKNKGKPIFKIPTRYAHLVEFGTSHSAAKPFMRPAWMTDGGERALQRFLIQMANNLSLEVSKLPKK